MKKYISTERRFLNRFPPCYYVIVKGEEEKCLFRSPAEYKFFLRLLKKLKKNLDIRLYAFCIMPNYFELVVRLPENPSLAQFIQELTAAYLQYFYKKYPGSGSVSFGRFKSMPITIDEDLCVCIASVESNPVRAQLADSPEKYPWSSCSLRGLGTSEGLLDVHA